MMKFLPNLMFVLASMSLFGQFNPTNPPNDCGEAVPGCTTPSFPISPNVPGTNNVDFGTGTFSNPSSNPNSVPGNSGCLLTGETSSTFITISVVSSGTLSWSIQGPNGGCFDWIMWPYTNSATTCAQILNAQLAPIACNWNAPCQGFTGMAPTGQLPAGANQGNFEKSLTVVAGQQFLLCLSNYSGTSQNVNLNFFGTANVSCGVSAPDKTICLGGSANVTIATPGFINPTFLWLTTNGVSNITGGTNVTVSPSTTTTYAVKVTQAATANSVLIVDTAVFTVTVENPPVPNAGLDDSLCFGSPIVLAGNVSSITNSKSWSYYNIGIQPAPTVQFSPNFTSLTPIINVNQPGLYGFVLKETSLVCGARRDTVLIYMKQMTGAANYTSPSCTGAGDGQLHLSGDGASIFSYNNGATWTSSPDSTGFGAGIYTVCVKDQIGCQVCLPVTVVDPMPISLSVSNDTLICRNGTAYLKALGTGGNSFDYLWSHTNNTQNLQVVNPSQDGYYGVVAKNEFGCESAKDSIFVSLRAPISGTISPNDTICPGFTSMVSASASDGFGGPYNFQWSNTSTGSGISNSALYSPGATEVVSVTISDNCESTPLVLSTEVFVSPIPFPEFVVDANEKCEPAIFELSIVSDSLTYSSSFWSISDGQYGAGKNSFTTSEMLHGSYDVQLILANKYGCVDSISYQNFLNPQKAPKASFLFNPGQPTMFNTRVAFQNTSVDGASFEWFFQDASPGYSIENEPVVFFPDGYSGNYPVKLITTSDFGCKDSTEEIVEVRPEVLLFAPNSFTPDGDQFNQEWFVVIEGIDNYSLEIEVVDRWGAIIWKSNDVDGRWDGTFNGQIVPSGVYTWNIKAKDFLTDQIHTFNGVINVIR